MRYHTLPYYTITKKNYITIPINILPQVYQTILEAFRRFPGNSAQLFLRLWPLGSARLILQGGETRRCEMCCLRQWGVPGNPLEIGFSNQFSKHIIFLKLNMFLHVFAIEGCTSYSQIPSSVVIVMAREFQVAWLIDPIASSLKQIERTEMWSSRGNCPTMFDYPSLIGASGFPFLNLHYRYL